MLLGYEGYEGYRSTDARHVQDSDDVLWLADLSPEEIPYVLWLNPSYENKVLEYKMQEKPENA